MEITLAEEFSAIRKALLHYSGLKGIKVYSICCKMEITLSQQGKNACHFLPRI
jgi:hypothetical protein